MKSRKRYDSQFKARVAVEAIQGHRTLSEIGSSYGVDPNQVGQWKKQALQSLPSMFSNPHERQQQDAEVLQSELYRQIGQLKVELEWVKKTQDLSVKPSGH